MIMPSEAGPDVHPPSGPPIVFIDFLLDETGSMSRCQQSTRSGFDEFVAAQRREPGECFLTLSKFDSTGIRTPYQNLRIAAVPPLSFFPGELTNLYDCMGDRLTAVMEQEREGRSLFVVMTDGDDNRSVRWKPEGVRDLVATAIAQGVSILFLGPEDSAAQTGATLGIPPECVRPFSTSRMRETMEDMSAAVSAFRAGGEPGTANAMENAHEDR